MSLEHIAKIRPLIKLDDRIIMAKKEISSFNFPVKQEALHNPYKPKGLWYAIGTEWIDWVEHEMSEWAGQIFYKIEITNKVLQIDNRKKFLEFDNKYVQTREKYDKTGPSFFHREGAPNWPLLATRCAGIEIAPYQHVFRSTYMWYYGWDVASGCIWDKSGIKKIEKIEVPN